ncbi:efflux RND transporter permease subunit [Fusibacter sp. 3D3]|uniref:efflux RND transporter permease subunit n=1 Tax=Fusibacter sp. 3D3 TaxID=1048380 RepID=UPI00085388CE|nr:efflux RND transporter permease subunit [Fusibacter sp. 3D3]GAU77251.1 RND multidrug efflux transporter acriflavin resistance protein [Fusibacter sp. 3D3]
MKDLPELKMPKNILGKIASGFIDRYKIVFLIIFAVLILGYNAYNSLPKETVPDVSTNMLYIFKTYPGASADDVNTLVSDPIEKKVKSLEGVDKVNATVQSGFVRIILEYSDDTDMDDAEQTVRNELAKISFPEGASDDATVGVFKTGDIPIFSITMTGNYNLAELKKYGERIQDEIENIPGIKQVDLSGGYDREIKVVVDQVRLLEYGLSYQNITSALQSSNMNMPAGEKNIDNTTVNIRVDERFTNVEDIRNLAIETSASRTIFLKDVATVEDAHKDPDNYSRVFVNNDDAEKVSTPAIYLTVYREDGNDIVGPASEIRAIIENKPEHAIPEDVDFIVTSDMSVDVVKDLSTVINNALGGLICVVIVLYIFIGLNEALIVATVIPISLFISFIVMTFTGVTFNTLSLAGFIIALGLLVDNAIVVMENIDRLRDEGVDRITASKFGTNQVAPAVLAATLTTLGAFVPVAMTPGVMGQFISNIPKTIIYIIAASFFVSIVITPTLSAKFLTPYKKKNSHHLFSDKIRNVTAGIVIFLLSLVAFSDQWKITNASILLAFVFTAVYAIKTFASKRAEKSNAPGMMEKYKQFIFTVLISRGKKFIIILLAVVMFIGSVMTIPLGILKVELFPYEEPTALKINIEAPVGTPLDDTDRIVKQVESNLYDIVDLESFTSKVGSDGFNKAEIVVELIDKDDRILSGSEIENQIRSRINIIPGAEFQLDQQSTMSPMSSGADVSLSLKGDNLDEIRPVAEQYLAELSKIEGIVEPRISTDGGKKEMIINIDGNRATYYGLTVAQISSELRKYISGSTVGTYVESSEEYDISVYYSEDQINSVKDFDRIFFMNNAGNKIYFDDVATLKIQTGIGSINKEDGEVIVSIEGDLKEGYNVREVSTAYSEAVKHIELPQNITTAVSGGMNDLNEQIGNMGRNFGIALLVVYIILVLQFNSFVQPMIILLSIPFALIGVILGLIITQNSLGFYAMFGIVALVGIAVNDAIVLIDYINYLRNTGVALRDAVAEAVKTRVQPVLATSLTTIGGVLPLALYNSTFSQLGFALIFGLIVSTVLTLLIIPMIYYSIEKRTMKWWKGEENENENE